MSIKVWLKSLITKFYIFTDLWRYRLSGLGKTRFASGEIAIDCGANIGLVTSVLVDAGATVYAFEPNPYAYEILRNRFAGNANVQCINKAVWDHNDTVRLYLHQNANEDQVKWSGGSSLVAEKSNIDRNNYVEVEAIDLPQFIRALAKPVKVLKMDVEGVEYEIIDALLETGIIEHIDSIFVETHHFKNPKFEQRARVLFEKIERNGLSSKFDMGWK